MKTNKILFGGLAGGVALYLLGWVIYGMLMMDYSMANYNQCLNRPMTEMIMWAMILSSFALGFLLALVFSWSNTTGILAGAKVAGIFGLLLSISLDFGFYSMTTMYPNLQVIFVDVMAYTVYLALAGAVIGGVMGMVKK